MAATADPAAPARGIAAAAAHAPRRTLAPEAENKLRQPHHREADCLNRRNTMLTYAQKKYLFAIYRLGNKGGMISSSDISRLVGVTKASTVKMTQRLTDEGYILKEPYGKIVLTDAGAKAASSLFTSSLIICDFLRNKVGIDENNADSDAVKIVTQVSEDTVDKLVKYALGDAAHA